MLNIKVAGSGCPSCQRLEQLCREVISEANIEAEIEKITDLYQFQELGVMMTPGLLLNGKVVSAGKIPTKETLEKWITTAND